MSNIIKFPKEKMQFANKITEAFIKEEYKYITSQKMEILSSLELYRDTEVIDLLVESFFEQGYFDDVVMLSDDLYNKGYESFDIIYLTLLSYISYMDIYQARNMIRRSKLLATPEAKQYYLDDGANYTNVMSMSDNNFNEMGYCLLLVNFIIELSKEMISITNIDNRYLFLRYFDMINTVYELGGDEDVAHELARVLRLLFQIEA